MSEHLTVFNKLTKEDEEIDINTIFKFEKYGEDVPFPSFKELVRAEFKKIYDEIITLTAEIEALKKT